MMESVMRDLRYGCRMLLKSPGFTLIAILTLGLGIGANTAMFSIVDAAMLRLPFKHASRVVAVENLYSASEHTPASFPDFQDWRQQNHVFSDLAASFQSNFNFTGGREPERISGTYISQGYFGLFGSNPALGRGFSPQDHKKGAASVCLISEEFWRREFNSDHAVLGRTLALDGVAYTVVGVMPSHTPDLHAPPRSDVWIPLEPKPPYDAHGTNYLQIIGRLKTGAAVSQAGSEMQLIQNRINAQFPENQHDLALLPIRDVLLGDTRPLLLVLLAAVGFVLLIACANVANLLLARATARAREFAVRDALGARRSRLVRQSLAESGLLAIFGLSAAALLTEPAASLLLHFWPEKLRKPEAIAFDWRIAAFATAVTVVTVLLFGLAPALFASRPDINLVLKESIHRATDSRSHRRLRSMFVISEIALALVLVIAAMLTLRSFDRLLHTDPGFSSQSLLTARIALPATRYSNAAAVRFFQDLLSRMRVLPGVQSVSASASVPLSGGGQTGDFRVEGRQFAAGQEPFAEEQFVTPEYFQTMQIRLVKGRYFTDADREGSQKVVIINETMAKHLWPGQDPVGKRIGILGGMDEWNPVVGVVADVKSNGLNEAAPLQAYLSYAQYPGRDMFVEVRSSTPAAAIPSLKRLVLEMDWQQPVSNVALMDQLLSRSVSGQRASTFLLTVFAGLAILLALIGIYGVMAYTVSQRTHEIGVRMALGAGERDIRNTVLAMAVRMSLWGIGAGILAALALTRFLRGLLFGIGTNDPSIFLASALLLAGAALLASYIPARQAVKVEPLRALRYE